MNLKDIQSLIKFIAESGVSEVDLETKELKINVKTQNCVPQYVEIQKPVQQVQASTPQTTEQAQTPAPVEEKTNYITIKSPIIGTFYRSPSPDKPTFVNVGDEIKPGQILCIIEAMKLFNEIECEVSGKIVKVLVDDSSPVEYDQPLFLVDPA